MSTIGKPAWSPGDLAVESSKIEVEYRAVRGDTYDFTRAVLLSPDGATFTNGDLLYALHVGSRRKISETIFFSKVSASWIQTRRPFYIHSDREADAEQNTSHEIS